MKSFALNLLIAIIWLFLSEEASLAVFMIGFLIGFVFLAAFSDFAGSGSYRRRVTAFLRFIGVFIGEFIRANLKVAWAALFRSRESLHPNFITYEITGLTRAEALLLSYCISLTPGTTTVSISPDFKLLLLHALDADQPELIRVELDRVLKQGILAFTR